MRTSKQISPGETFKGRKHFAFAATVWKEFDQPLRLNFPGGFQQIDQPTP
jgi:hypothetical protein